MKRQLETAVIVISALLWLAVGPVSAQVTTAPSWARSVAGIWAQALPEETAAPKAPEPKAVDTQKGQDHVLGMFEGEDNLLFWFASDLRFTSKSIQEYLRKSEEIRLRNVGDVLKESGKGSWIILREPLGKAAHFTFADKKTGEAYYVPVPKNLEYGDEKLNLASITVANDRLVGEYGGRSSGTLILQKFIPDEARTQSSSAIYIYKKSLKQSSIELAWVFDGDAFTHLFLQPELKDAKAVLEKTGNLKKMAAFLGKGTDRSSDVDVPDRSIQVEPYGFGALLFRFKEGQKDQRCIYLKGNSVMEFPVR